jgi:hypothetical protein
MWFTIFLWAKQSAACSLKSQENWQLIRRFEISHCLSPKGAFLKGAKISENNLALLKQRGANDDKNFLINSEQWLLETKRLMGHILAVIVPLPQMQRMKEYKAYGPIFTNSDIILRILNYAWGKENFHGDIDVNSLPRLLKDL